MAVDKDFYMNVYGGSDLPDIDRLLVRAERAVECLIVTDPVTDREQRYYDLAVCAQAEYIALCGGVEAWAVSSSGNASNITVGSFSMSQGGASAESGKNTARGICSEVFGLLEKGGLLYRGCCAW